MTNLILMLESVASRREKRQTLSFTFANMLSVGSTWSIILEDSFVAGFVYIGVAVAVFNTEG